MSMLCSAVAALSSFYPEAKDIFDPVQRNISIIRLVAKVPTIAASLYRHMKACRSSIRDNDLSYGENFLSMSPDERSRNTSNPVFTRATRFCSSSRGS